jgi:tellurite resistance protein TerA
MIDLVRGANAPLPSGTFEIVLGWPTTAGTLDASAFLVGENGRVRDDGDMVFYNQPAAQDDCVQLRDGIDGLARFVVSLPSVPADVARIIFCLTIDGTDQSIAAFNGLDLIVAAGTGIACRFQPDLADAGEVALMVAELYRRQDSWKIRAIAQGFRGGLAALATSLGINVEGEEQAAPADVAPAASSASEPGPAPGPALAPEPGPAPEPAIAPAPPPPPPPEEPEEPEAPPPLAARSPSARLLAGDDRLALAAAGGRLSITLDWRWSIGGLNGRIRPISLALGAAFVHADGRVGAVQPPDTRGQIDAPPWLQLAGVTARGTDLGQERLLFELSRLEDYARIDVYAFIAHGSPSWIGCETWINIAGIAGGPSGGHDFRIDPPADGNTAVALLRIETGDDGHWLRRLDASAYDQQALDAILGWGLTWRRQPPV